jgi:hypothetical protein
MFINVLITFFCACLITGFSVFSATAGEGNIVDLCHVEHVPIEHVPNVTPEKQKRKCGVVKKMEEGSSLMLSDEPKTIDDLRMRGTADLLKRIDDRLLPEGVSCWDVYLLALNADDAQGAAQHFLATQHRQIKQLKEMQLKSRLFEAQKTYDAMQEEVYAYGELYRGAVLSPYRQCVRDLEEAVSPFRLSYSEMQCYLFIVDNAGQYKDGVIRLFLTKTSLLPIARIHGMFHEALFAKTHNRLVANTALQYFVEKYDPEESPRRVHSEYITFVLDIFRIIPELRGDAAMVAKIFTRIGAINPSSRQFLYAGNWQNKYSFFWKEENDAGVVWHKRSVVKEASDGLFQLANSYEMVNSLVDDFCRNYLSLMMHGCHFDGVIQYVSEDGQIVPYVGEHLYLRTVQSIVSGKYVSVASEEAAMARDDKMSALRIGNLQALTTFMELYSGFGDFISLFNCDEVIEVCQNIMTNKCYERSDIDSLARLVERNPLVEKFINFIQGAFFIRA